MQLSRIKQLFSIYHVHSVVLSFNQLLPNKAIYYMYKQQQNINEKQ